MGAITRAPKRPGGRNVLARSDDDGRTFRNVVQMPFGFVYVTWQDQARTCELTSSIVPRVTSFHCRVDLVDRDRLVKNPLTVSSAVLERIASEAAAQGRRPAGS
jgi:hypothetical protein